MRDNSRCQQEYVNISIGKIYSHNGGGVGYSHYVKFQWRYIEVCLAVSKHVQTKSTLASLSADNNFAATKGC